MARNKLTDLNNHLFETLERLNDDELMDSEKGKAEIDRARAVANISKSIINNAKIILESAKFAEEYNVRAETIRDALTLLDGGNNEAD